jgi:hypothetical protein
VSLGSFGTPIFPLPPPPQIKKGVGHFFSDILSITLVVSGPPISGAVWFAYAKVLWMVLIVPVRVLDSWCMDVGPVSWGLSNPADVRLIVVLLVVVWPLVSNIPIYTGCGIRSVTYDFVINLFWVKFGKF